jgi:hypothetical protein
MNAFTWKVWLNVVAACTIVALPARATEPDQPSGSIDPQPSGASIEGTSANLTTSSQSMEQVPSVTRLSELNGTPSTGMAQVTSVSQLTDVKPTDWVFQALQSLVERYGCIAGYPDRTFRGNRALTRYEFAAGVNACLDRVNELINAATK